MSLSVITEHLHIPPMKELCQVILKGLESNFKEASCEIVQCPDLSQEPWKLATKGLCGKSSIGEIGGVKYLLPLAKTEKIYDLRDIANEIGYEDGLVIGAGAGPLTYLGKNSEMIPNLRIGSTIENETRVAMTTEDDLNIKLEKLPLTECRCSLLMNFFASSGHQDKVLKIKARNRTGEDNFITCIRKSLTEYYKDKTIGLGGTFRMTSGKAKIHVMPTFSKGPLNSDVQVNNWLKFFDVEAPMVFMSVFASRDPGLDFRIEHTHGYGVSQGGHYHYDITPDLIEYEGYFNIAEVMYRVDKP